MLVVCPHNGLARAGHCVGCWRFIGTGKGCWELWGDIASIISGRVVPPSKWQTGLPMRVQRPCR
jgi:hypothetical protein